MGACTNLTIMDPCSLLPVAVVKRHNAFHLLLCQLVRSQSRPQNKSGIAVPHRQLLRQRLNCMVFENGFDAQVTFFKDAGEGSVVLQQMGKPCQKGWMVVLNVVVD